MLSALYGSVNFVAEQLTPPLSTRIKYLRQASHLIHENERLASKVGACIVGGEIFNTCLIVNRKFKICTGNGYDPIGWYADTPCQRIENGRNIVQDVSLQCYIIAIGFGIAGLFYEAGQFVDLALKSLESEQLE